MVIRVVTTFITRVLFGGRLTIILAISAWWGLHQVIQLRWTGMQQQYISQYEARGILNDIAIRLEYTPYSLLMVKAGLSG
ncbi:hypothetical protein G112A_00222 [Candidatus Nanosynsacchari sp. TM7_G1_3_12Alb]|nr:hypothetical protein G112A_00222 [Candidatus Nanosynsacchari sp. TM7_G1_3_12Alb]